MFNSIEISPEVEAIFHRVGRFGETHDDVLKRLFADHIRAAQPPAPAKKVLDSTDRAMMERLLLWVVHQAGGVIDSKVAMSAIAKRFEWKDADTETLPSGVKRWKKNMHSACWRLRQKQLLVPAAMCDRGSWELTHAGKGLATSNQSSTNAA